MDRRMVRACRILTAIAVLTLFAVAGASGMSAVGRTVLGLYKSNDGQTQKENEINFYLSGVLKGMGLDVRFHDIDSGLPTAGELNGVRAVVTWYRSSAMSSPVAYLDFLNKMIDSGRKVIVFENFGAYQDRQSGKYLQPGILNPTLERLGLVYLGDWTDKGNLIRVASVDRAVAEHGGAQDPSVSQFYYRFIPVDRNLRVYLSLTRTDQSYSPSPVIVTNDHGGFALSRYIYRVENGKVHMLIDLKAFMENALFPTATRENIGLLADTTDPKTARILALTEAVLRRDKLPTTLIPASSFSGLVPGDLRRFTAVGLIVKSDADIDPGVIESYLKQGGSLVSLNRAHVTRLAGLLAMGPSHAVPPPQTGYNIPPGFLLGEGLDVRDQQLEWQPGDRGPAPDATVLGSSLDGRQALFWTAERDGGKVLVWNWSSFDTGDYQGAILESFMYVRPVGIAANAGLAMMYIDDFPQPMYNVVKPPLSITDTEFYSTVWWPQIRDIFANRHIPFSAFLVFNYNAETQPPFATGEFYAAKDQVNLKIAREILASDNELGLHGYNHASLTMQSTSVNIRPWPSIADMVTALSQAKREWSSLFGPSTLPFSYVAPNNIISEAGMEAIHEAIPSIHVIASLRAGSSQETDTPFGPHPSIPGIYLIPRNSWGYILDGASKMRIVSAMSGPGIWAHFIHPDDVFDPNRSRGLSWNELRVNFTQMLDFVKRNYPWVEYKTVRDGYSVLQTMDDRQASFRWEGRSMHIRSTPGLLLRVRTNIGRVQSMSGARLVYSYEHMPELIIRTTSEEAVLNF